MYADNNKGLDAENLSYPVLRIQNGLLAGVEFTLNTAYTLFRIGDASLAEADSLAQTDRLATGQSLYIPSAEPGPNFAVDLSAPSAGSDFTLLIYDEEPPTSQAGQYQTLYQIGSLEIALRAADSSWQPAQALAVESADAPVERRLSQRSNWLKAGVAVVVLLVLAGLAYYGHSAQRQSVPSAQARRLTAERQQLQSLLADDANQLAISPGPKPTMYVLAPDDLAAARARQALARQSFALPVKILSREQERARLDHWLSQQLPAYITLRLDNWQQPVLVLSRERLQAAPQALAAIQAKVRAQMPYSAGLSIEQVSERQVLSDACSALKRLGIPYRLAPGSAPQLLRVSGAFDDVQREQVTQQIQDFYRRYGAHLLRFALELQDDPFKGQSYKYGAEGYVQLAPGKWYFPQPS